MSANTGNLGADGGHDIEMLPAAVPWLRLPRAWRHFSHQAMERDGYFGSHNGHSTAERQRLWRGTMGSFGEVLLLPLGHWVCAASVPSSGFPCHRYAGCLFADNHGAKCGNSHHLSLAALASSALGSQGRRLSRQGQTITRRHSLSCNEPGIEKLN